jgi:hypothetical protein
MRKVLFWKNDFSHRAISPKPVKEGNSRFAVAIGAQRENDRLRFEATIARMMRDAAMPALGKNTTR